MRGRGGGRATAPVEVCDVDRILDRHCDAREHAEGRCGIHAQRAARWHRSPQGGHRQLTPASAKTRLIAMTGEGVIRLHDFLLNRNKILPLASFSCTGPLMSPRVQRLAGGGGRGALGLQSHRCCLPSGAMAVTLKAHASYPSFTRNLAIST